MICDSSVCVIGIEKNNHKYGMTCAWFMPVDYDKLVCLLGEQSETGKVIQKGDIVGVSILSKEQINIANNFGENHSNLINKFDNVNYEIDDTAILINNSTRKMKCKVIDVLHLEGIEVDNLIYLNILTTDENGDDFLHYSEL